MFSLSQELVKDSTYSLSLMMKMDQGASYGISYLGVHLLKEFPTNITEDFWNKVPEEVLPIEDLSVESNWVEKQILIRAKGGEKFIALGAVYPSYNLIKNKNFKPIKNEQLNQMKVFVDVLSAPHTVDDMSELKPQKHGLIIKDKSGKTGFIMPGIKGIKTVNKQIETIKSEYKISEKEIKNLELWYFKSTRYD